MLKYSHFCFSNRTLTSWWWQLLRTFLGWKQKLNFGIMQGKMAQQFKYLLFLFNRIKRTSSTLRSQKQLVGNDSRPCIHGNIVNFPYKFLVLEYGTVPNCILVPFWIYCQIAHITQTGQSFPSESKRLNACEIV